MEKPHDQATLRVLLTDGTWVRSTLSLPETGQTAEDVASALLGILTPSHVRVLRLGRHVLMTSQIAMIEVESIERGTADAHAE